MPKGYWIARIDVHDSEAYKQYFEAGRAAYERYNAKFLIRGGKSEAVEGKGRSRNVVIEFASFADAHACYNSPEYAKALPFRQKASIGEIILVEGV
jgi:uncharacterized protein (DUF1330 family)